jgi:hypothetical protein
MDNLRVRVMSGHARFLFLAVGCILLGIQFGALAGAGIFLLSAAQIEW